MAINNFYKRGHTFVGPPPADGSAPHRSRIDFVRAPTGLTHAFIRCDVWRRCSRQVRKSTHFINHRPVVCKFQLGPSIPPTSAPSERWDSDALSSAARAGEGRTEFLQDLAQSINNTEQEHQQFINEGNLDELYAELLRGSRGEAPRHFSQANSRPKWYDEALERRLRLLKMRATITSTRPAPSTR